MDGAFEVKNNVNDFNDAQDWVKMTRPGGYSKLLK